MAIQDNIKVVAEFQDNASANIKKLNDQLNEFAKGVKEGAQAELDAFRGAQQGADKLNEALYNFWVAVSCENLRGVDAQFVYFVAYALRKEKRARFDLQNRVQVCTCCSETVRFELSGAGCEVGCIHDKSPFGCLSQQRCCDVVTITVFLGFLEEKQK